jgi:hypothetical protein
MAQKELNLDEILKQLSAPQAKGSAVTLTGSPVWYGSGCKQPDPQV